MKICQCLPIIISAVICVACVNGGDEVLRVRGFDATHTDEIQSVSRQTACLGVSCAANNSSDIYVIRVNVSGLQDPSSGMVLQNKGVDTIFVDADGIYTFGMHGNSGDTYKVSVVMPPAGQDCSITNSNGSITNADVSTIRVDCHASTSWPIAVSLSNKLAQHR